MSMVTAAGRARGGTLGTFLKLIFIKLVQYLEICALPYLAGIGCGISMGWQIPPRVWEALSNVGVMGTVAILYSPVILLHAAFIFHLKKRNPGFSHLFFLEDTLAEHRFTKGLALLGAVMSFVFGVVNYNFAIDTSDPRHVSHFVSKPWETNPVAVTGKIIREPEFRDFNVWLYIQPEDVDRQPVSGGLILVKVARSVEGFEEFDYGQYVRVRGNLREPEPAMNPGAFDYKHHLNNRNIFGLMSVTKGEGIDPLERKDSNFMFDISLWVKEKFLGIMKQTLPYPHSAFQGGIIYGLRTGLPAEQHFEFKWAGMAWVLVVAGAHLLMVYLTLKMILETVRPNPKVSFSILFFLLLMFLILTGINPPTVRAFIMIMLYEFTRTFLGQDIQGAIRSAIGIAAFLLLASHFFPYFSPLMIFDATVTLSFCAVLSLIYLSRPVDHLLRRYCYGTTSVVVLCGVISTLVSMSILRPTTLSVLSVQLLPIWIVTVILAVITVRINDKYRDQYHLDRIYLGYNDDRRFGGWKKWIHPNFLTYNHLPGWILGFLGAQVAIQFGMVLPLSSYYFQRSPVGGFLANLIAFPALGVIIQVGLVAVLIGMIPVIGIPLAFILNAADYLGIQLLMNVAHYSKVFFPYPMAMKPTGSQMLLYYGILIGFILFDHIFYSFEKRGYLTLRELFEQKFIFTKSPVYGRLVNLVKTRKREWAAITVAVVVLGSVGFVMAQGQDLDHLRVIVLELDEGSGTIIETPGGLRFLVDAGRIDSRGTFDVGERTLAPILLCQQMEHLDGIFVTSLKSENLGGIPFLLENFTVGRLFVPFDPAALKSSEPFTSKDLEKLAGTGRRRGEKGIVQTLDKMRMIIRERKIPVMRLTDTVVVGGENLKIETLNPPNDTRWTQAAGESNGGLVFRITCGPNSILLGGDLDAQGQDALARRYPDLRSKFLLLPAHGDPRAVSDSFIAAVHPEFTAVQYRPPPWTRSENGGEDPIDNVLKRYVSLGAAVYRTDLHGAITVDAWPDGRFEVTPILQTAIPEYVTGLEEESDTDVQDRKGLKSEGTGL